MRIAFGIRNAVARVCASYLFAMLFFVASLSAQSSNSDLVLLNAHVVTLNDKQSSAQAIAISGERIVWVGGTDEAKKLYRTTRVMDLHGATVLPGIIDAHTHLINLGETLVRLNLKDIPTEKEIIERVKQRAASAAPGEWILGFELPYQSSVERGCAAQSCLPRRPAYLCGLG